MKTQLQNQFKSNLTPIKGNKFKPTDPEVMMAIIGRDYERPKLVAPVFEIDLKSSKNNGIAYSQTVMKCGSGRFC